MVSETMRCHEISTSHIAQESSIGMWFAPYFPGNLSTQEQKIETSDDVGTALMEMLNGL